VECPNIGTDDSVFCSVYGVALELPFVLRNPMAYVITETCTKDELCVEACPVDCIHPKKDEDGFEEAKQLFVNPDDCIDCGACVPVCQSNSVFPADELPEDLAHFAAENAAHYAN